MDKGIMARISEEHETDRLRRDKARINAAIDLAAAAIDHNRCFTDEWGLPLPGDADAIESWAMRHAPRFLLHATSRNGNGSLVRICDFRAELVEAFGLVIRSCGDSMDNIVHRIYDLTKIEPVASEHPNREGVQHYRCVPLDVTEHFAV